jgi:hypothetical protein
MGGRTSASLLALALLMAPAGAVHKAKTTTPPEPPRNFVGYDLSAPAPEAPHRGQNSAVELLDSLSVKRDADIVRFDVLEIISPLSDRHPRTQGPSGRPRTMLEHYRASCGWRTLTLESHTEDSRDVRENPSEAGETEIMRPEYNVAPLLDRLCIAPPLEAAEGLPTIAAVVARWTNMFAPPGDPLPVQLAPDPTKNPILLAATPGSAHLIELYRDKASGNALFFDTSTLARAGNSATSLSAEFLGPMPSGPMSKWRRVGASRRVRYDCAARTMTVLSEVYVNPDGIVIAETRQPAESRAAAASPVTAAEIAAACDGPPSGAPVYTSMQDAWLSVNPAPATPAP